MKTDCLVTSTEELANIVEASKEHGIVALDTEFVWERTYYPRLGLVQIGLSEKECHLIDIPSIKDLSPLGELLSDGSVIKILHDAQQDLTILQRETGAFPKNIFDSQCAAGFAGLPSTISLRDLLNKLFDVQISKSETRTNWFKRPLSERQTAYAMDDVRYLPKARNELMSRVKKEIYTKWMEEELSILDDPATYEAKDPHLQFERVKGARRLSGPDRAVLRELAAWRELEAQSQDRPRGHIIADETLIAISRRQPSSVEQLKGIRGLFADELGQYGAVIIEMTQKGRTSSWVGEGDRGEVYADNEALNARVDFALAYMKGKSIAEGIDQALVGSRSDVTALIYNCFGKRSDKPRLLEGWRRSFMGDELLELMRGRYALRLDSATGLPKLDPGDQ